MFDHLSERLQAAVGSMWEDKILNEDNIETALREVRRALLEADVNLKALRAFLSAVQDRAVGEQILKSVDPSQQFIKIVHDELTNLLGKDSSPLILEGEPSIIMLFGLQGSGKTTTASKLALKLTQEMKRSVLLVAADVYRPAAIDQLVYLGKQIDVPVFTLPGETNVSRIVRDALKQAAETKVDTVIVDTAGRLQADTEMMAELLLLEREFKPREKLLVVDAMTGQEAVNVALTFNTQIEVTGLILSKMDGDARGGAALSVVHMTGKPIKFVGVSEKPSGLEVFHPERLASRMLGMGDVVSLVEKAQQAVDEEAALKMQDKFRENSFSFEDYLKLQGQMKMLGSLDGILGMLPIPGLDKQTRSQLAKTSEAQSHRLQAMVNSMTPIERKTPDLLSPSRRSRVAAGCGIPETEVSQMIDQFLQMRGMMQQFTQMMDGMKSGNFDLGSLFGGMFGGDDDDDELMSLPKKPKKAPPWLPR